MGKLFSRRACPPWSAAFQHGGQARRLNVPFPNHHNPLPHPPSALPLDLRASYRDNFGCAFHSLGEVKVPGGAASADPTGSRTLCSGPCARPGSARSAAPKRGIPWTIVGVTVQRSLQPGLPPLPKGEGNCQLSPLPPSVGQQADQAGSQQHNRRRLWDCAEGDFYGHAIAGIVPCVSGENSSRCVA